MQAPEISAVDIPGAGMEITSAQDMRNVVLHRGTPTSPTQRLACQKER